MMIGNSHVSKTIKLFALVCILAGPVRTICAQEIVADLSDHLIAVTTGFSGTKLLLFGAIEGDAADIIIVVRGPAEEVVVRRKDSLGGIWVNRDHLAFQGVPAFYRIASTRPVEEIASNRILARQGIGIKYIRFKTSIEQSGNLSKFKAALIRNKQRMELYPETNGQIALLGNRLFRSDIFFPSNVPTGKYNVTVYLLRDNKVISAQTTPLVVSKIGVGAQVFAFANNHAALYGIAAVVIALFAGWFAGAIFKSS